MMRITKKDREILRDLAKRAAEIAALPTQAERIALWKKHNSLAPCRPMILVFPEGSWRELLPPESPACRGRKAREIERALRMRIYTHEHFRDDTVVEGAWFVPKAVSHTGWGPKPRLKRSEMETGAYTFNPVIRKPADLRKLRRPEVVYDEKLTADNLALAHDLFDGILDVRLKGVAHVSFHLYNIYIYLRGLNEVLLDMYENPGMLHDAMHILEEGYRGLLRQWGEMDLFDLNNDNTYQNSGGNGWTDEIPRKAAVAGVASRSQSGPPGVSSSCVAQPPSAGASSAYVAHPPSGVIASSQEAKTQPGAAALHQQETQARAPVLHKPKKVTPADMWASAESQEFAVVSPEMHREFAMQYEERLLKGFALTGYGCCEPLERKIDLVLALPNMRRISIAPSADVAKCAEQIGPRAILSWKPQPSMLVGEFNENKVRDYIAHALAVAKANGCTMEMILKDTHTCENHPERFTRWTEIARKLVSS